MIGQQINQFKITDKIGQGGMGEVYLAEDTRLHRKVALKFLPPHYSKDPEFKSRFEHEARAAAALNHPNIITVYELGEHAGRTFIAMELVEGATLEVRIKAGDIGPSEAVDIAQQVCEGLSTAHEAGIVHRDIKPANIFIAQSGRVKILDFGLAKSRKSTTETREGTTVGTVQYESPEQSRGDKVDGRSDLFSLGVVLYEMITSHRPFQGEFEDAVRYAIAHENPEPLARYKTDVPDELQRIVSKLLEKDPDLRYQTAAGVVSDLKLLKRSSGPHPSSVHSAVQSAVTPTSPTAPSLPVAPKRSVARFVVPATIVVLALVVALVFKPWKVEISPTQEAVAGEDRLAVMYFDNLVDPQDESRLGEIVTNLLITALSETKDLKVLSSQRLYDILKQLGKEETHAVDRETASQVAQMANAKWMLMGTILQTEPRLVITAQVIDVASGQVEASRRSTAEDSEEIFSQVDRLAADFRGEILGPGAGVAASERSLTEMTTHSQEAYRYYLEGLDQLKRLYRIEAKGSLKKAVAIDSTFVMAHFWLANAFADDAEGQEHLRQAVKYSNKASEAQRLFIFALADFFAADWDGSIAGLKQVIELEPDNKDAIQALAYIYDREKNQPDSAIRYLEEVLKFDPKAHSVLNSIAYLYKDLRQVDRGLEYIHRYIEIVPDEPNPYDSQGELYASKGDFESAIASYRKALAIDPGFESALGALAKIYACRGDYETADSCARALIAQPEGEVRARGRLGLAIVAATRGRFNEALQLADQGIVADRMEQEEKLSYVYKFAVRSMIFAQLERWPDAVLAVEQTVNQARRLLPEDLFPWENAYMVALARVGDTARAHEILDLLEHRLTTQGGTNSDRAWLGIAQGRVQLVQGNTDAAIRYLKAAALLNRRNLRPIAEYYLAQAYLKAGRPADAAPLLERLVTTLENIKYWNPFDHVHAFFMLGQAYEETGKTREAARQYRRVLEIYENGDPEIPLRDKARQRLEQLQT